MSDFVRVRFNGYPDGRGGYRDSDDLMLGPVDRRVGPFRQGQPHVLPADDSEFVLGLYNRGDDDPCPVFTLLPDDDDATGTDATTKPTGPTTDAPPTAPDATGTDATTKPAKPSKTTKTDETTEEAQ